MHSRSSLRVFAIERRGPDALAAVACFAVAIAAAMALVTLLFVRHAHVAPGGHGYWTDAFGFRAGVDNLGPGTAVSVLLNPHLHWQHNVGVIGSLLVVVLGYELGMHSWAASKAGHEGARP